MASPLGPAGAQTRPSEYAPIHTNEWWTGLWTNRNPMRDAATPYLYQKFYSAARYESMLDGSNVEITPRLTPARRAGSSVYNSQTFSAINDFYAFRTFNTTTFAEGIRVIADTATDVFDATGPSTKTSLLTKATGAAQTSFQSLGNTLYMADGIDQKKWLYFQQWAAATTYQVGQPIIDSNGNIQVATGVNIALTPTGSGVQVANGVLTIGIASGPLWSIEQLSSFPGSTATFAGFVGASFINGQILNVVSAYNQGSVTAGHPTHFLTFAFSHADYAYTADAAGIVTLNAGSGNSFGIVPTWNVNLGGTTVDGGITWTNKGLPVIDWQITGPIAAPLVSNVLTPAGQPWAASTYYWPSGNPIIIDSNGNIQQLTTDGTTGTVPVWSSTPGVTTADGSAVWTCRGSGTRGTTTAYVIGAWIAVSAVRSFQVVSSYDPYSHTFTYKTVTITTLYFFRCSIAGTTSSTSTANVAWPSTLGGSVADGSVTWVNAGDQVTRLNSAAISPTGTGAGNVANSLLVTQVGSIVDNAGSGAGTGYAQNVTLAGKSGAAPPTWATTGSPAAEQAGLVTTESGGLTWYNFGPVGAPNTGSWVYAYSFGNSVTGGESTASLLSTPIILAADSVVSVSGNGDPNFATDGSDVINIYRSLQGFSVPFRLIQIPAPLNGAPWSYLDASPDPPNPGSILNEFISPDLVGNNSPPPTGATGLTYYLSRMWCIVGEFVYYSSAPQGSVGVNTDNWNLNDNFQMPSVVTKLWASTSGILFFTNQGIYLSSGVDGNGRPNQPVPLPLEDIGLLSPNCFAVNGSVPLLFTGDRQFISLDPAAGVSRAGFPIEDQLALFDPTSSYVTWHTSGSDQGAYIADGSTGWFRVNLTPAPESGGYTWSPRATIVGGCKCIKSIETSPGIRNLLIGTATTGPILKRDFSTHQDNGSNYAAFFTVGNIVLSQPGQAAEVEFITTECLKNGSNVAVSILCDEIAASGPQGFELLTGDSTNDPPWATPSNTLFSTRWYLGPTRQPSWMRHLQITFTWPTENAANEMLTYTMYAALRNDNA